MVEAIILGIVQGLTEFVPVSSTAHLILFPLFFGWEEAMSSLSFDIALHAGTLLALLIYFRGQWFELLFKDRRLFMILATGTIPAAVSGLLFEKAVSTTLRSPLIIAASLLIVGIVMLSADRDGHKRRTFSSIGHNGCLINRPCTGCSVDTRCLKIGHYHLCRALQRH